MFALPGFLLISITAGAVRTVLLVATWTFTVGGLLLSYWAAVGYIPLARTALREGRAVGEAA